MQTFYLYIKDEVGIDINTLMSCNVVTELFLLLPLDAVELVNNVISKFTFELFKLIKVTYPSLADKIGDEFGQFGVAQTEPSTLSDTIGLVLEAFRIECIPLFENVIFEYLSMYPSNTIYIA